MLVSVLVVVLGLGAAAGFVAWLARDPRAAMPLFDLNAYRIGGTRVVHGVSLYDTPLIGDTRGVFEFVYAPFAGLLFAPLAWVSDAGMVPVGLVLGVVLLVAVVALSLLALTAGRSGSAPEPSGGAPEPPGGAEDRSDGGRGWPAARAWPVAAGLVGLLLWCEPVWQTITFGQVNLLLAALVLGDLARPAGARGRGVLIGIAAGIKLTPAFFVLHLLVTRRYREAAVATGSFLATVAIGALVAPRDSLTFWSGAFADPARVGVPTHPGNQSLRGLIARELGTGTGSQLLWLALALPLAVLGLWLAARLQSRGRTLDAAVTSGMTSMLVSPFSWVHHWVWFGPLLVVVIDRAVRAHSAGSWVRAWLACLVVAAIGCHWFFSGGDALLAHLSGPLATVFRVGYQNGYVWLTALVLVVSAMGSARASRRTLAR